MAPSLAFEPEARWPADGLSPVAPRALPVNLAEGKASAVCAAAEAESARTLLQAKAKAKAIRTVARSLELQPAHGETAVRTGIGLGSGARGLGVRG